MASYPKRSRYSDDISDEEDVSSDETQEYSTGSVVFCSEDGIFYKAIIKSIEQRHGMIYYKIHYHGFNARLDEFISEDEAKTRFRDFDETPGTLKRLNEESDEESPPAKQKKPPANLPTSKKLQRLAVSNETHLKETLSANLDVILKVDHDAMKKSKLSKSSALSTIKQVIEEYKGTVQADDTFVELSRDELRKFIFNQ